MDADVRYNPMLEPAAIADRATASFARCDIVNRGVVTAFYAVYVTEDGRDVDRVWSYSDSPHGMWQGWWRGPAGCPERQRLDAWLQVPTRRR